MKILMMVLMVGSFLCGGVSIHYKLFPFDYLTSIKMALIPITELTPAYSSQLALFDEVERDVDVVFLGDSITRGGMWSELFPNHTVSNRGIGGDTSKGIINRLDGVLSLNPDVVFLMFGVNDIRRGAGISDVLSNYTEICKTLYSGGAKVIIQSTLLTGRASDNVKINALNLALINMAINNGIAYIDINKALAPSGLLSSKISYDGTHLYHHSYIKWRDAIKNHTPTTVRL